MKIFHIGKTARKREKDKIVYVQFNENDYNDFFSIHNKNAHMSLYTETHDNRIIIIESTIVILYIALQMNVLRDKCSFRKTTAKLWTTKVLFFCFIEVISTFAICFVISFCKTFSEPAFILG